jgi:putative tryptophan/tyrosine transport system substrate-binding protein
VPTSISGPPGLPRGDRVKCREFITLLGGAAAWPLAASAQQAGRVYRIGSLQTAPRNAPHQLAFFAEIGRLGFVEGQNLMIDSPGYGLRVDQYSFISLPHLGVSPFHFVTDGTTRREATVARRPGASVSP